MGATERLTLPIPYGHHVYVVSDLSLSPRTDAKSRPVREFIDLLGDIDDAAVVVVAGNFFHPDSTADLAKFIDATFHALPELRNAITAYTSLEGHQFFVLPGSNDIELRESDRAQLELETMGIQLASDLMLNIATADGVRDLAVAAGTSHIDLSRADSDDRSDADRLEDPLALNRFVTSRVLYRRLGPWVWLPIVAMVLYDLSSGIAKIFDHLTAHKIHIALHIGHPHAQNFWSDLIINLLLIILLEAVVIGIAGLIVRQRFDHTSRSIHAPELSEPLAATVVDGVDAVEYARRVGERSGAGAIVGGAPRPALAFLDRGMCASPGPSRTVVVEHRGRLGLPPVFSSVDRWSYLVVEAAGTVQVRLIAGESPRKRGTLLERIVSGINVQPSPSAPTSLIGSWPSGQPFPVALDRLRSQRLQRTIRRVASGLMFSVGLLNVVSTASAPLHSKLHAVLSVLPLGVSQSAAVLTGIAGVALIMTARGLRRGQRRAWFFSIAALSISIIGHIARGEHIPSALAALVLLLFIISQRSHFQGTTDRGSLRNVLSRLVLIAIVAAFAATLGLEASFAHRHLPSFGVLLVACFERLLGLSNIALPDGAGDFINPVLLAIGSALLISALYIITRPVVDRRLSTHSSSTERRLAELRARDIVKRHGRGTLDYFALRDDKQFFFFRDSLVAYAVYGGVALISPDPIGPGAERSEVFSAFRAFAETRGWTIGIMAASEQWLSIYRAAGMHYLYLGDEAIVDVQKFSLEGGKMKGLRQACTRLAKHGYTVEFIDPAHIEPKRVPDIMEMIAMLRRGEGERGFSMMLGRLFDPKDKGLLLTMVHDANGMPVALCQFVPSLALNGYSLDIMRRDPGDHPNGLIDFALCATIAHLREQGAQGLSLNFAAFRSVLDGERGEGTFTRVERWALKRLSGILPIESLWTFNSKYQPDWFPRHLVYPAVESFVPVVAAVLRAESLTEIPVLGRFLKDDPTNRPGTVVPPEILEAAALSNKEGAS